MPLRSTYASAVLQAVRHMALSLPGCEASRLTQGKKTPPFMAPLKTALLRLMTEGCARL
jgi:hypothetical protein